MHLQKVKEWWLTGRLFFDSLFPWRQSVRHTSEEFIASIDRHAPRNWRRSLLPEPRLLVLSELESFALSSSAFAKGHLWNEAWEDVGFPIQAARQSTKVYLQSHPDKAHGVVHFGPSFVIEIAQMVRIQDVPGYLATIVDQIQGGADDVFQEAELFWSDGSVRLRFHE